MPTNNLSPKAKNKLGIASSIPPNMAERFGAAVSPYLQGAQALFPPTNPYGQVVSNFLLGQAPQAAQQMAAGYPNVLFNTSNPLGGNRIVNPVALDMALALPVATAVKGAGALAKSAPLVGGITAWHGSPHLFPPTPLNDLGEFNAAKIGSGEGAQAYGMGHYTAEARGTGEGYRDQLARSQVEPGDYAEYFAPNSVRPTYGGHDKILDFDPESGIVTAQSVVKNKNDEWVPEPNSQVRRHKTMPNVAELEKTLGRKPGHLYKVDIPDEQIAKMLDWDKPLSEQSEEVQKIIGEMLADPTTLLGRGAEHYALTPEDLQDASGKFLHDLISYDKLKNAAQAAEILKQAGIPGVRYLDAASREAGEGTSNFVVFPGNENMMTILERNGQARSVPTQANTLNSRQIRELIDKNSPNESLDFDALRSAIGGNSYELTNYDISKLHAGDLSVDASKAMPSKGAIVIGKDGEIIDGRHRAALAKSAGNTHIQAYTPVAASPESQAIARYREVKGPKSVVRMEAALRTAGVPLPKNEPVAYIQRLVDQAHRRN
jgi:hypothetical protein